MSVPNVPPSKGGTPPDLTNRLPGFANRASRSLGLKLMVVCVLVVLMAIPAMLISYVSFERSQRSEQVANEIASRYGGEQYVTGPILVAPYAVTDPNGYVMETGQYVVFPETGHAEFKNIKTTIRKRSLFRVPTYAGDGVIKATFPTIDKVPSVSGMTIDWTQSEIWTGVSETLGLQSDVTIHMPDGSNRVFEPARQRTFTVPNEGLSVAYEGVEGINPAYNNIARPPVKRQLSLIEMGSQHYMSVSAADITAKDNIEPFTVSVKMKLGGTRRLGVMPFAKTTHFSLSADWPDPGFEGGFAPTSRNITQDGFTAEWSVPYLARGIPGTGEAHTLPIYNLSKTAMSVKFVSAYNPYQTVNRALKYSVLFIGLVFIAYFLFEVMIGVRVHPAQYILIGLAQSVFYLLLLAFAERLGFTIAFMMAAFATISITAAYAASVFRSKKYGYRAGAIFMTVYGLLYALMQMQDFALMIGALAALIVIAATMYMTRNVDWYGDSDTAQ